MGFSVLVGSIYEKKHLYPPKIATKGFSTDFSTIGYSQWHTKNPPKSEYRKWCFFKMADKMAASSLKSLYVIYYSSYSNTFGVYTHVLGVNESIKSIINNTGWLGKGSHHWILKWPPFKSCFAYISVCEAHKDFILVSIPMFSGSMNPLGAVLMLLVNLLKAAILNFKMAANLITVFSISRYACNIET
jgi:hypothetical protein